MPVVLQLSRPCLAALERSLAVAWPEEGCALLLGGRHGETLHVQRIWPCRNVWRPGWAEESLPQPHSRSDRFVVDPRELIAAQKYGRRCGRLLLGVAHSHPGGSARPSAMDQRHAWPQTVVWISAVASPDSRLSEGDRGAWWVGESGDFQALSIDLVQTV